MPIELHVLTSPPDQPKHDPYEVLRIREYLLLLISRFAASMGGSGLAAVVGWELYQRTHKPMALAISGLVQAIPILLFALQAGTVADLFPRKQVSIVGQSVACLSALALALVSLSQVPVHTIYLCLFINTSAGAFANPARQALLPEVVPIRLLPAAVSWNTSIVRVAMVLGAALGGWLVAWTGHAFVPYLGTAACGLVSIALMSRLSYRPAPVEKRERPNWNILAAGIHFIFDTKIILATITLDLFAVLLGGADTLIPVYARDILHVGPGGYGWLQSAPSAGALVMALILTHLPPFRKPGSTMLVAVAGFGVATIVFGVARTMPVALVALFLIGALDMISVVVRSSLVQTLTPREMQGRVSAVNSVFITTSNQVGGFESGLLAQYTSPVFSVVFGGIGTLAVVLLTAVAWPSVRSYRAGVSQD